MTILEFHEKLKAGKVSAREATNGYLEEIKTHNKRLGAYLEVHTDDAFSDAQRIDERVREGEAPGVLWGIPLAIKDNILIRGKRASAASRISPHAIRIIPTMFRADLPVALLLR